MKPSILALGLLIILAWGTWGFMAKLAQARVGSQVLIWYLIASNIMLFGYLALSNQLWPLRIDGPGIGWGLAVGISASLGTILFYILLATAPTSLVVPLTSIYPAVTVALGVWLLREQLTINQGIGVVLAVAAIYFLSR